MGILLLLNKITENVKINAHFDNTLEYGYDNRVFKLLV